jgi:membrane protease subunit HflC
MNPAAVKLPIIVAIVLGFLAFNSIYVVNETEQVVITQLGRPVGQAIADAGMHFKIPFIQRANYFERRIMKWDGNPNQIPTKDKKYIWVDVTARWRISDGLLFLQRVGNITTAHSRLDGIIDSVVRDYVSNNDLIELVRSEGWEDARRLMEEAGIQEFRLAGNSEDAGSTETDKPLVKGREKITREMVADASRLLPQFGIDLQDIRIKRINYVESVQKKVFDRMISERKRIAAQYRSEGQGERAAILGQMERELAKITSEAYRKSQEIRGRADAEATRIYADAYGKNVDFFQLYRTFDLYKSFKLPESSFFLTTEADIFKYLKGSGGPLDR